MRYADYPLLAKLTSIGIALHMGTYLGLANQLALALLGLALILLVLWGYRMWWLRRGKPVPAGFLAEGAGLMLLPLAALVALTGWFVPLLGLSLLAFLAIDGTRSLLARRRTRTA